MVINVREKEQQGGWANIQIVSLDEFVYCPDVLTNENSASIVIISELDGLDVLPVAENLKITEPLSRTKSGIIYNIRGDFEISCQTKQLDDYFDKYVLKKVVMIGTKHYGQQKLYGSKKFPLIFSYTYLNGQKSEQGSRIRIRISGKIPQKPVFLTE
jgi:hypothetical protein